MDEENSDPDESRDVQRTPVNSKRKAHEGRLRTLRAKRAHRKELILGGKDARKERASYPGLRFQGAVHRALAWLYALVFLGFAAIFLWRAIQDRGNVTLWAAFGGCVIATPIAYLFAIVSAELCHILVQAGVLLDDRLGGK